MSLKTSLELDMFKVPIAHKRLFRAQCQLTCENQFLSPIARVAVLIPPYDAHLDQKKTERLDGVGSHSIFIILYGVIETVEQLIIFRGNL